jgi:hypothetical protein
LSGGIPASLPGSPVHRSQELDVVPLERDSILGMNLIGIRTPDQIFACKAIIASFFERQSKLCFRRWGNENPARRHRLRMRSFELRDYFAGWRRHRQ